MWMFVFLFLSSFVYAAERDDSRSLGIFGVSILDVSPATVPVVALEQRSDARVKYFLGIHSLDIDPRIDYRIERVKFGLEPGSGKYVSYVRTDYFAPESEDLAYNDYFGFLSSSSEKTIAVANIGLQRISSGRKIPIKEDTAEKVCSKELEPRHNLTENIPDEINLTMRVEVRFVACEGRFVREDENDPNSKEVCYKEGSTEGGYLTRRYFRQDEYDEDRITNCIANIDSRNALKLSRGQEIDAAKTKEEKDRCYSIYSHQIQRITDVIYVDAYIGVDKTNLDKLVDPEELREQICRTIEYKKQVNKWKNETEKLENTFENIVWLHF